MVPHFVLFEHEVKTKRGAGLVLNLVCAWIGKEARLAAFTPVLLTPKDSKQD